MITVPRTAKELKALINRDQRIKFVFEMELSDLYNCGGIDGLNDKVDKLIGNIAGVDELLEGLDYRVVGCKNGTRKQEGSVFIEVSASAESLVFEE